MQQVTFFFWQIPPPVDDLLQRRLFETHGFSPQRSWAGHELKVMVTGYLVVGYLMVVGMVVVGVEAIWTE